MGFYVRFLKVHKYRFACNLFSWLTCISILIIFPRAEASHMMRKQRDMIATQGNNNDETPKTPLKENNIDLECNTIY
jgi:hypothetical protein